ncbi:unnamed protein product [Calypogeia fissa]
MDSSSLSTVVAPPLMVNAWSEPHQSRVPRDCVSCKARNPIRLNFQVHIPRHETGKAFVSSKRIVQCQELNNLPRLPSILSSKHQVKQREQRRHLGGTVWASGGVGETTESVSTSGGETIEDLKQAVMRAVSNTNRGKDTTYQQRQAILNLIEKLEVLNLTQDPINSPLFSGRYALLYTAPVDEKTADKYAGTEEGPFLARVKPAAFGSVRQIRSTQVLDTLGGAAQNIADFIVFGVNGSLNIKGSVVKAAPSSKGAIRVDVTFESFVITIGKWTSPSISLSWINPKGWIDTTFLDEDMRVGRGDKGSIFVAVRIKD